MVATLNLGLLAKTGTLVGVGESVAVGEDVGVGVAAPPHPGSSQNNAVIIVTTPRIFISLPLSFNVFLLNIEMFINGASGKTRKIIYFRYSVK